MLFSSESVCEDEDEENEGSESGAAAKYTGHEDPTQCLDVQAKIGKTAAALDQVNLELKSARKSLTGAKRLLADLRLNNKVATTTATTTQATTTAQAVATSTSSTSRQTNQTVKEGDMVLSVEPGQVRVGEAVVVFAKINSNTTYYTLEIYKDNKLYATLLTNTFIASAQRPFSFQKSYITMPTMPTGTYQIKLSDTYMKTIYAVTNLDVLPKTAAVISKAPNNSYQYTGPLGSTLTAVKSGTATANNYITFTKPLANAEVQANRGFVISWVFTGAKGKSMDIYADASCESSGACTIGSNTRILVAKNIKVSDKGYAWWVPSSLIGKKVRLYAEQAGQQAGTGPLFTIVKSIYY